MPELTNFHERLVFSMKQKGVKQVDIVKATGVTKGTVSNWVSGKTMPDKPDVLAKLCKMLDISPHWLATGEGERTTPQIDNNVEPFIPQKTRLLPVISWVMAGEFCENGDNDYSDYEPSSQDWGHYWLVIQGDSMLPKFEMGDKILIDTDRQPRTGDYVVARVAGQEETTFKKAKLNLFDEQGREYMQLVALNEFYPPIDSRNRAFEIVGVAVEHKQSLV